MTFAYSWEVCLKRTTFIPYHIHLSRLWERLVQSFCFHKILENHNLAIGALRNLRFHTMFKMSPNVAFFKCTVNKLLTRTQPKLFMLLALAFWYVSFRFADFIVYLYLHIPYVILFFIPEFSNRGTFILFMV